MKINILQISNFNLYLTSSTVLYKHLKWRIILSKRKRKVVDVSYKARRQYILILLVLKQIIKLVSTYAELWDSVKVISNIIK